MNTSWTDFLHHTATADSAASDALRLAPMLDHRLLMLQGADASRFLQGQTTCDLRRLGQNQFLLGAHCNAKGRMVSSFLLAALSEEHILIKLRADIADSAAQALRKYLVFSKARLQISDWMVLTLRAPAASQWPELPGLPPLPELGQFALWSVDPTDRALVLRRAPDLVELWLSNAQAQRLWSLWQGQVAPQSPSAVDAYWIDQGVAEVQAATQEAFIPQMFNYHLLDGVSFNKGCYTGQEIVARMQYRGQLKKHVYRLCANATAAATVGSALYATAEDDQACATLVASACDQGVWHALAVVSDEVNTNTDGLWDKKTGTKLTWQALPYAIPKQ